MPHLIASRPVRVRIGTSAGRTTPISSKWCGRRSACSPITPGFPCDAAEVMMGRRSRANASRAAEGTHASTPGAGAQRNHADDIAARSHPGATPAAAADARRNRPVPVLVSARSIATRGSADLARDVQCRATRPAPRSLSSARAVFGGATTRPNFGVWRGPRPVGNKIAPPRGPRRQSTPARPSSRTPGVVSPSSPYVVARAVSALRRARLRGRGEVGRPRDRALPPAERRRRAVGTPSVLVRRAPRALRAAHLRRPRRHRFPPRRQRRRTLDRRHASFPRRGGRPRRRQGVGHLFRVPTPPRGRSAEKSGPTRAADSSSAARRFDARTPSPRATTFAPPSRSSRPSPPT